MVTFTNYLSTKILTGRLCPHSPLGRSTHIMIGYITYLYTIFELEYDVEVQIWAFIHELLEKQFYYLIVFVFLIIKCLK